MQAKDDASAELAGGWQKLKDAQEAAEKEQAKAIQQAEDLKAAAQRELESAQKATSEAQEKGYQETMSTYTLAIRLVLVFAVILGLIEVIKNWYIIGMYYYCYTEFRDAYGSFAATAVAVPAVVIFAGAYFAPWSNCDRHEYYFGLSIRLILLVWLFATADAVSIKTALITIYLSCFVVGLCRWMLNKA